LKVIHSFSWGKSTTDPLTLKHNLLPINQNIVGEGNSKENTIILYNNWFSKHF
jgi:hypothetical protein